MGHERLSAQDAAFLDLENGDLPMHVGAVARFGPTAFRSAGGVSMEAVRQLVASRLPALPRYRRRLDAIPLTGHPIWVDDRFFDLRYHIRHVSLPAEGASAALDELARAFFSQKLDRSRPLWEIVVADGLPMGQIGALFKAHHALIDGVSGVDMLILLLGLSPTREVPVPVRWEARAKTSAPLLLLEELRRRTSLPAAWLGMAREAVGAPRATLAAARDRVVGLGQVLGYALDAGADTPLNAGTGPNRRLATLRVGLDEIKELKRTLGGTLNDVAVAIAAGGLRRFFAGRGASPDGFDVRAMIPVSTRADIERGTLGNKLAVLIAPIPVDEGDPRARLAKVRETLDGLKSSRAALGNEVINLAAEWTTPRVISETIRMAARRRAMHVMVTNIRGPSEPLYFLDAPLLEVYPSAPLWPEQTLTIGIMSYGGWLHWGLTVDADHFEDVEDLADAIRLEIQELAKLARESGPAER